MDPQVHNLDAVQLGTGEFSFAPQATSVADARAKGYLDFGNLQITGLKPSIEKVDHEGSYRGKKRIDKTAATKGVFEYSLKCDEIDREKLKLALGGVDAANITQSTQAATPGDTLGFTATPAVIGRWYDLLISGVQIREVTALKIRSAATSCTADSTTDKITATAHGLLAGDKVVFGGTAVPAGLIAGTVYYVVSPNTNDFQVAATVGGTAIDLTSAGTAVTFQKEFTQDTDFVLDGKIGRVRFLTAQAADRVPIITADAITAGGNANLQGIAPMDTLIQDGYGRVAIFDDTHPNKLVYLHEGFSCQVFLDSMTEFDGKSFTDITLKVRVTATLGTVYCAE